jgi:hypothetical protein
MKRFKREQYVCLKPECTPCGIWGYLCHSFEIDGDDIYLISGGANIRHNIKDVKEDYVKYIMGLINENN